jgi:hypothetical protein
MRPGRRLALSFCLKAGAVFRLNLPEPPPLQIRLQEGLQEAASFLQEACKNVQLSILYPKTPLISLVLQFLQFAATIVLKQERVLSPSRRRSGL